jgi:hypothetical protein
MHPRIKEKILIVDSRYAYVNNDDLFDYTLSEPINNMISLKLLNVSVAWCWTNINKWNNSITFTDVKEQTVIIPIGNYDTSSILSALKTALESTDQGRTYTVTFSEITNKISIGVVGGNTTISATSIINNLIGISIDKELVAGAASSVMDYAVNLMPTNQLEIRLPRLVKSIEGKPYIVGKPNDLCELITLSGFSPWDYISLGSQDTIEMEPEVKSMDHIAIAIVDSDGYTPDELYESYKRYPFTLIFRVKYASFD